MWFFLLWLGFAVWVFFDAKKRCMKNPALEAVGVLGLGIIFLPLYFAKRNLYKGEVREGGMAWNAVKVFALYWTITMFVASLAGLGAASQMVVEETSEAAQAGAAVGTMLGMGLMIGLWFAVLAGILVIGLFLKKSSMVENGPTGGLAEQENPPKKLGVALLVVWVAISSMAVLVASGKDGGKGEKSSGNTPKTSVSTSAASEPLPALEARFIEIVSAAQGESRRAENDMQRGGIKARREKALCEAITSAATDWIGTIEEVTSNSDGKGVLEIAIAEGIKIKTWNNALSDAGNNTLIEPGSPVFEAASAMKRGQRVAFSGVFFKGSQGDCLHESSMSLRGKLEEPEFIFRFSRVSANMPTQQSHTLATESRKASTQQAEAERITKKTEDFVQLHQDADSVVWLVKLEPYKNNLVYATLVYDYANVANHMGYEGMNDYQSAKVGYWVDCGKLTIGFHHLEPYSSHMAKGEPMEMDVINRSWGNVEFLDVSQAGPYSEVDSSAAKVVKLACNKD